MATTDRAELHKTIWKIANDLRGSVDGWDFKQYVLGTLFYRFISENLTNYLNQHQLKAGIKDFDYSKLSDKDAEFGRKETVLEKGFFILPSELFVNVRAGAKNDANLNETMSRVFRNIEGSAVGSPSELDLKGLFDDIDVNSNKIGGTVTKRNELLVKLLDSVGELALGNYADNSIDAFGDAYEYLMTMYASNAGKSGGEFFTPQEVSELLAKITVVGKKKVNKVYDPACGSGSLLLQFAKVLGKDNVTDGFYGQEINITTYNLCRINMFLHDINYEKFDIAHGDTLTEPIHWDEQPFEAIVSNPPYSINWDGDSNPLLINDPRFSPAGVLAPKSKADMAFTLHILHWLAPNGTAAIVEYPGLMYRSGAEQKIRKYLVDNNYVDAVIQLPKDLFFGTNIETCILVLKKAKKSNDVLFINADKEFLRQGNKNKLSAENMIKILDTFKDRTEIPHFSKLVTHSEIAERDYLLSVTGYVVDEDKRVLLNLDQLNAQINAVVDTQIKMRKEIDSLIANVTEFQVSHSKSSQYRELTLGEVGTFTRGNGLQKADFVESGEPCIHYGQIYTHFGSMTESVISYVTSQTASKLKKAKPGDIILTTTSENIADVCKSLAWMGGSEVSIGGHSCVFRHDLDPFFATYYFQSHHFQIQKNYYVHGTKVKDIKVSDLAKIKIMVPDLETQKRIGRVLKSFDELINNVTSGLPAEIALRKQQYDFYRDSLISAKSESLAE
jgi:type I restriction enzyme M protein